MDDLLCPGDARNNSLRSWLLCALLRVFGIFRRRTMHSSHLPGIAIVSIHESELGFANPNCVCQHGLEYGLQLAGRRADDAQHVGCCSDSVNSRVRCCSASNSRTFSMAITAWSAKILTSSICLLLNGWTSV